MEKDNRNISEDILTRFSLLTDDVNVNSIKGWPYINLGEFFQKDYPEMFSALKLGINIKKCNISISIKAKQSTTSIGITAPHGRG